MITIEEYENLKPGDKIKLINQDNSSISVVKHLTIGDKEAPKLGSGIKQIK